MHYLDDDIRYNLDLAWTLMSDYGIDSGGNFLDVEKRSLEESIAFAIIMARFDSRLYVATRNLINFHVKTDSFFANNSLTKIIEAIYACKEDSLDIKLRAKYAIYALFEKSGITISLEYEPIFPRVNFFNINITPRIPDPAMLKYGIVVHRHSDTHMRKFLNPRLLKKFPFVDLG